MAYTLGTKHTSPYSDQAQSGDVTSFLLQESLFYLLQETGSKIILDQSNPTTWTNATKH